VEFAGLENEGVENDGLENDGPENDGVEQEQTYMLQTKTNFNGYDPLRHYCFKHKSNDIYFSAFTVILIEKNE